jgi:hypothetical protein
MAILAPLSEKNRYRSPYQEIAPFYATPTETEISSYRTMLQGLAKGAGAYDFTARPTTWMDIQAQQVSATGAAREAMAFNEANMGRFTSMARSLTEADVATRTAMLDQYVPDWRQQRDKAASINEALMSGEIPKDVADQLKRSAAYTSVMGGGGAGTQRALTARDLGLTSLELQQRGMTGAERWTNMMANLLPEQTSAADIMATQGLTSEQARVTAMQNADLALRAATTNVEGRTKTALSVEDQRLRGEEQKRLADASAAQIQSTGFGNILTARMGLEKQKYDVATQAAEIAMQNMAMVQPTYQSGYERGAGGFGSVYTYNRPSWDYSGVQSASGYGFGIR